MKHGDINTQGIIQGDGEYFNPTNLISNGNFGLNILKTIRS